MELLGSYMETNVRRHAESSRPSAAPLATASRPVESSRPRTTTVLRIGKTSPLVVNSDIKGQTIKDRAGFISKGQKPVPLAAEGFNHFSDVKNSIGSGGQADNIQIRPRVSGVTYAMGGGGDLTQSVCVDYAPGNDGLDREVITKPVDVITEPGTTKARDQRITFSPIRFPVWRQVKGVPIDAALTDLQAVADKQIPKGTYLFTFKLTPDPAGSYASYTDGFTFSVNGKVQSLDKAEYDGKTGIVRIQITVKENLVWLIPLGIAGAAALGWMFSEADDVLAQVDRILVDSWIPIAAAGAGLAMYFLWKRSR